MFPSSSSSSCLLSRRRHQKQQQQYEDDACVSSSCLREANLLAPDLCADADLLLLSPEAAEHVHQHEPLTVQIPVGPLTLGKLSVIILLLATIMEVLVTQVHRLESHDMYDALSAEVIRPAFRYTKSAVGTSRPSSRSSLGSAAIASITETLSPILPFTGGLDLRREDYWITPGKNWIQRFQSVAEQVKDAFTQQQQQDDNHDSVSAENNLKTKNASLQQGETVAGKTVYAPVSHSPQSRVHSHVSAISAPQCFLDLATIGEMTLSDVSEAFRYAVECNQEGFNEARFVNGLSSPRLKQVIAAMQSAMIKSRGADAQLSLAATTPSRSGVIDALAFTAAMRIFAEWRLLRQVPEGYKGFAVGMNLGYKDVLQNIAKIESTVHAFLDHRRDNRLEEGNVLRSPTLREVLEYDVEMDLNPASRLPRLNDKTAAMGLLWVRRQLQYQTLLFDNVLQIPTHFASTPDAVAAAYKSTYDKYHGWAVQKIFNYSFQSAPTAEEIYKHMNPQKLRDVQATAQRIRLPSSAAEEPTSSASSLSDQTTTTPPQQDDNPVEAVLKHLGGEWDKILGAIGQLFDPNSQNNNNNNNNNQKELNVRGGGAPPPDSAAVERFITQEMIKDAHEHIQVYLRVAHPLLDDLAALFDEMNMDDPTKV